MQAQNPSSSATEATTNPLAIRNVVRSKAPAEIRLDDIQSYCVPGLVDSQLNPTLRFVTLADFDTLLREVEHLRQFRELIKQICENPKNRTKRTQLQMCKLLDEVRLKAVSAGACKQWGSS